MGERPAIYVHFEFGVSWSPRHAPRSGRLAYMSRNMRDRAKQFPRQLPPANTNFLTASTACPDSYYLQQYQQQYQLQYPSHGTQSRAYAQHTATAPGHEAQREAETNAVVPRSHYQISHEPAWHSLQQQSNQPRYAHRSQHSQPYQRHHHQYNSQSSQESEPRRTSRSQSKGNQERGSSAPPPFNDSPWDAEPEPMAATALPGTSRQRSRPQLWKALPATPDQYRLGEANLPWTSYNFPMGYVEDGEDDSSNDGDSPRSGKLDDAPEFSRQQDLDDRQKGIAREMQSLAAALMTVDNGFEDQWWHQGPRIVTINSGLSSASKDTPLKVRDENFGWPLSDREQDLFHQPRSAAPSQSSGSSSADVVSPMSECPSPVPSFQGLRRSLTTRSDELNW